MLQKISTRIQRIWKWEDSFLIHNEDVLHPRQASKERQGTITITITWRIESGTRKWKALLFIFRFWNILVKYCWSGGGDPRTPLKQSDSTRSTPIRSQHSHFARDRSWDSGVTDHHRIQCPTEGLNLFIINATFTYIIIASRPQRTCLNVMTLTETRSKELKILMWIRYQMRLRINVYNWI